MTSEVFPEPFVDAARAADFLSITPRRLLDMARSGELPAHPLGSGKRKTWRFLLSELHDHIRTGITKKVFTERATHSMVRPQAGPGAIGTEG
jgi:Helix-turn-helix domain